MKLFFIISLIFISLPGCSGNKNKSDAYGNFEAVEVLVSAEANGKLLSFDVQEGMMIDSNKIIGTIDTSQLVLNRKQLEAQRASINTRFSGILAQVAVLNQQKETALVDKARIEKMLEGKAATRKQLDDINGAISLINKQVNQIETQNPTVINDSKSLDVQIARTNDLIKKSIIINPIRGTVLNKFVEQYEYVTQGKPLYKIANLDDIILRVYISGSQLPNVKIGQNVKVLIDKDEKLNRELAGTVSWISSQAEFTPKIIQTKEERVNTVFAVKVIVKNDGFLKIGMPGEIRF